MINGVIALRHGKLTLVDEEGKREYATKVGRELLTKASIRIPSLKADLV